MHRVFGPKKNNYTIGRRKMFNDPHDLYSSRNITAVMDVRRMPWAENVTRMGETINSDSISVRVQLGKPRYRWEYNFKTDVKEVTCEGVGWFESVGCISVHVSQGGSDEDEG
jgi:hypothetical protein